MNLFISLPNATEMGDNQLVIDQFKIFSSEIEFHFITVRIILKHRIQNKIIEAYQSKLLQF